MPFAISDEHLPAVLTAPPMTDAEFTEFCAEHPDMMFEMTAEGELIVMAPTHFLTGLRGSEITSALGLWARKDGRGGATDSSTGYVLPNGARRSPDASWTRRTRINALNPEDRRGFLHLCPDFIIELSSQSDRLKTVQKKMLEYMANGAELGWLIDPAKRSVTIYRPNGEIEIRNEIDSISGEGLLATFTLDLTYVWDPK